jgi:hypothetical protein
MGHDTARLSSSEDGHVLAGASLFFDEAAGPCRLDYVVRLDASWNIRRLALPVGSEAPVRAAWLRFPSLELEPLEQVYRHVTEWKYRYESNGGSFTADLAVDDAGFVTLYPGFCERVHAGR